MEGSKMLLTHVLLVMGAVTMVTKACMCSGPPQLQHSFCNDHFVIKAMVLNTTYYTNSDEDKYYTFAVKKIFKAPDDYVNETIWQVYTPRHDGACGIGLYGGRATRYIITGSIDNQGRLFMQLCANVAMPWEYLTRTEKSGLRNRYKKLCPRYRSRWENRTRSRTQSTPL